jgi:hypothetical protein
MSAPRCAPSPPSDPSESLRDIVRFPSIDRLESHQNMIANLPI